MKQLVAIFKLSVGSFIQVTHHSAADDARVTDLALRAGRGDRAALTEFIKATQDDVWRLLAHLGGPEGADDLTQETYLRVISALPRFAARSSARTWLLSLARRVWVDNIRHDMARPRKSATEYEDAMGAAPEESAAWSEWIDARTLIDALPADRREAGGLRATHAGALLQCAKVLRRRQDQAAPLPPCEAAPACVARKPPASRRRCGR